MHPLFTSKELSQAKSRDKLPFICLHCSKKFYMLKNKVLAVIKGKANNKAKFCSTLCGALHLNPPITVKCTQCGKDFIKAPKEIKKSKSGNHFCCTSCAAKWSNAHKTKGNRRSKLEKWIETQLPLLFPNIVFEYNKTSAINAELDIYIPSLKLAFELNGIFHYEPIFGQEKLASMQTNDKRKYQACLENSIELCILDVSKMEYFKLDKAQIFLNIICDIIRTKLQVLSQHL